MAADHSGGSANTTKFLPTQDRTETQSRCLSDQGHVWYNRIDSHKTGVRTMLQADVVREILAGYARANEVIEQERMERLARMTPEEARAIYDDLVNGWRAPASPAEAQRLDLWRAETTTATRRAFQALARAMRVL